MSAAVYVGSPARRGTLRTAPLRLDFRVAVATATVVYSLSRLSGTLAAWPVARGGQNTALIIERMAYICLYWYQRSTPGRGCDPLPAS